MEMNWLITGGCGFIGTNLVRQLILEGMKGKIRVFDSFEVGQPEHVENALKGLPARRVEFLQGDIRDFEATSKAAEGADIVVHLAANTGVQPSILDPRADLMANVTGTFNVLEACRQRKVSRFVFASSGAPIGNTEPPIHEKIAPRPASPYGASKLAGEGYCSAYAHSFGLHTSALRFGNVYGPYSRNKSSVVARFIKLALAGETLTINGDGTQTRDYVYVGDLIGAITATATKNTPPGEIFQIATGKETSVRELAEELARAFETLGFHFPDFIYSSPLSGEVKRNFSDTSKAARMLGWQSRVALQEGLEKTVHYFANLQQENGKPEN